MMDTILRVRLIRPDKSVIYQELFNGSIPHIPLTVGSEGLTYLRSGNYPSIAGPFDVEISVASEGK